MHDPDVFDHGHLGAFRRTKLGWLGRGDDAADACDLLLEAGAPDDEFPPETRALAVLDETVCGLAGLKARAVETICTHRQAALDWRSGPPLECWSLIEVRVTRSSDVWLTLHEYETDEYSRWLVRLSPAFAPVEVRRVPALPLEAPAKDAGTRIWLADTI